MLAAHALAYPVDGYDYTGIRRLEYAQGVQSGAVPGRKMHAGQYLPTAAIEPDWRASDGRALPPLDAELSRRIALLVPAANRDDYAIALVDLSDPQQPVYAAHNPQTQTNVGSVAKILVALALFQKLADLYPNDIAARERVLRDTQITADDFSQYDHHKVPFWNRESAQETSRQIRVGDRGSLWEYLDWMMSASSNSAGGDGAEGTDHAEPLRHTLPGDGRGRNRVLRQNATRRARGNPRTNHDQRAAAQRFRSGENPPGQPLHARRQPARRRRPRVMRRPSNW